MRLKTECPAEIAKEITQSRAQPAGSADSVCVSPGWSSHSPSLGVSIR